MDRVKWMEGCLGRGSGLRETRVLIICLLAFGRGGTAAYYRHFCQPTYTSFVGSNPCARVTTNLAGQAAQQGWRHKRRRDDVVCRKK